MTILVPIALWGFLPFSLLVFAILPVRRAIIATFLLGWMFLPIAGYPIRGLPDYTKTSAVSLGVMLGMLLIDHGQTLIRFKPRWIDLPVLVWCLCPIPTSLANDLGIYDGLSQALDQVITWGIPYLVARAAFTEPEHLRELAIGLFLGGLIYLPLCAYEIRMSPQLHNYFYGQHQHTFLQHIRGDTYRPMVFMNHGLMVTIFMTSATVSGLWLWSSRSLRRVGPIPMGLCVLGLIVVTVLCKSVAAAILLLAGFGCWAIYRATRMTLPMLLLAIVPPIYLAARMTDAWAGEWVVPAVDAWISEQRAKSLQFRIDNEVFLKDHALERPVFGWGGHNRAKVEDNTEGVWGRGVAESLWILAVGERGIIGLASMTLMHVLAPLLLLMRLRHSNLLDPLVAPAAGLALICLLKMVDNLANAMNNPVHVLALGACASLLYARSRRPTPAHAPVTQQRLGTVIVRPPMAPIARS